jgi:hypothetical protein
MLYYLLGRDESSMKLMRQHGDLTEKESDNQQPWQIGVFMKVISIRSFNCQHEQKHICCEAII